MILMHSKLKTSEIYMLLNDGSSIATFPYDFITLDITTLIDLKTKFIIIPIDFQKVCVLLFDGYYGH